MSVWQAIHLPHQSTTLKPTLSVHLLSSWLSGVHIDRKLVYLQFLRCPRKMLRLQKKKFKNSLTIGHFLAGEIQHFIWPIFGSPLQDETMSRPESNSPQKIVHFEKKIEGISLRNGHFMNIESCTNLKINNVWFNFFVYNPPLGQQMWCPRVGTSLSCPRGGW